MGLFDLFFPQIHKSDMLEVRISRSILESPLEFEITRVDCMSFIFMLKAPVTIEANSILLLFFPEILRLDISCDLSACQKHCRMLSAAILNVAIRLENTLRK